VAVGALLLVNGTDNLLLSNATDDLLLARSTSIDATLLTSNVDDTDATSYATASVSPAANSLLLLFTLTAHGTLVAPGATPTSTHGTWVPLGDRTWGGAPGVRRCGAWYLQCGGSPGSGAITLTMTDKGGGTTSIQGGWTVIEVTGHDVGDPVRQAAFPPGVTGTSHTVVLSDPIDSKNRPFSFFAHRIAEATTFRTNWSELSDNTGSSPAVGIESQWRSDAFETTASASWTTGTTAFGIAVEVAEAGAADAPSAFIAARAETSATASPVAVTMPSDVVAGDLLIATVSTDAAATVAAGGGEGWTNITDTANGSAVRLNILAKIAAGGDALNLTLGSADDSATHVMRIVDHGVANVATDIEVGTAATGTSAAPDPPSVTPAANANNLFIVVAASDDDDDIVTFAPTNYTAEAQTKSTTGTSSCLIQVATRYIATGSAVDPAAGALNLSEEWVTQTLCVPPASSGATGTAAVTEAADTSTATGTETFTGTSATAEAADTSTATGTETFTGTSATTEEADTSTASGTHIQNVTGTVAATEGDDTSTASGTETFTGTSATTEADDTSTAAGAETFSGSAAVTEADDTSGASGTVGSVGGISATLHPVSTYEPAAAVGTLEPATTVHTFAPATVVRTFNA
jgi:hypothetical protein